MRKTLYPGIGIILALCTLFSCTTYSLYSRNLLAGKNLLDQREYARAQNFFQKAAENNVDGAAYTYLAVIAYKQKDFGKAASMIESAEKRPPDMLSGLRMYGYKALILIALNDPGAMRALDDYIARYGSMYPLESINDIKSMRQSGRIDADRLEAIIDDELAWYEKDMELYIYNHVGYYSRDKTDKF